MLVSVVVPTYNREKLIAKTLDSIINQTYKDIEVLVIDDGSKDNTQDVIQRYISLYPQKIKYFLKENGGVSSARNLGIDKSKGEYICFVDSDDWIYPTKIEKQLKQLLSQEYDACYCGYNTLDSDDRVLSRNRIAFVRDNVLLEYVKNKAVSHISALLINNLHLKEKNIRFTEGCSWGEDIEFYIKVLCEFKATYVDEYLCNYVVYDLGSGNLSEFNWEKLDKDVYIWEKIWAYIKNSKMDKFIKQKIEKIIFGYRLPAGILNRINLQLADKEQAREYFLKYQHIIKCGCYCNGLRSVKFYLTLWKLKTILNVKI